MKNGRILTFLVVCLASVLTTPAVRAGQDQILARLNEAKGLYDSAEYDKALSVIEKIDASTVTPKQARDRALYEALCLLALNRKPEAESRIEEVVKNQPLFGPEKDMSPRLRAVFDDVRVRMRPGLVQGHYRAGKDRFDAKDYAAAVKEFTLVLELVVQASDPAEASVFSDVKTLAAGFRDLAESLRSPSPAHAPALDSSPARDTDPAVTPPVTVRQHLPAWPQTVASHAVIEQRPLSGLLEVLVSHSGDVKWAKIVKSVHPVYDALLLSAAKHWKYEPATQAGRTVEFVKRLAVNVTVK